MLKKTFTLWIGVIVYFCGFLFKYHFRKRRQTAVHLETYPHPARGKTRSDGPLSLNETNFPVQTAKPPTTEKAKWQMHPGVHPRSNGQSCFTRFQSLRPHTTIITTPSSPLRYPIPTSTSISIPRRGIVAPVVAAEGGEYGEAAR